MNYPIKRFVWIRCEIAFELTVAAPYPGFFPRMEHAAGQGCCKIGKRQRICANECLTWKAAVPPDEIRNIGDSSCPRGSRNRRPLVSGRAARCWSIDDCGLKIQQDQ